ncbi:MAG: hypothetical protein PUH30_12480 [Oscillospiraceae bacterium]|nr:hypothetical protein [Oscillospiraceae bacterium]
MSKKITKSIAATAAALLMATQAMAFSASAVQNYYYYYNGIYYSSPYDAAAAAGNNNGAWEAVASSRIPSGASLKYYDSVSKKYYDTKALADAAGVANPTEIYVGSYYINNNYYTTGTGYYCSLTGKYYVTYADALSAAGGQAKYVTYVGNYAVNNRYYSSRTGLYYSTYAAALSASNGDASKVTYMGGDYWYDWSGYGKYYSSLTGKYYNNYSDAVSASKGNSAYVTYAGGYYNNYYNYSGYFYSSYTGKYYSSYAAAVTASNGNTAYVTAVGNLYNSNSTIVNGSIYKYYYNGVAYPTLQAAKDAGGTVGVDIYYSPYGKTDSTGYYYYYNGTYYGTLEAAKRAGGTALGTDITYVPYNYYGNAYTNYYGYYSNYGYIDPYYALRDQLKNNQNNTSVSNKTAEDGEPYIYGKKNRAGWSTVIKYINAASKGDNIKVDMNGASTVSKDVLAALDGKNVSVTFVLDNGVKWTINGKNVDTAQDMIIYTQYNIDFIPAKLVSKASKDAVAKAQIGISNNYDSFGSEASVTVKFATKRSGCTAVVYRYDPDTNSLKGIAKSKVQSDGSCTFSVTAGGPYLVVLK